MAVMPVPKRRKLSPAEGGTHGGRSADTQDAFYKQAAGWNLEQDYEQRPRKKRKEKESTRLPIKTAEGRIEQVKSLELQRDDSDNWFDSEDQPKEDHIQVEEQPKVPIYQQILDAKEELARLATSINEDPEEHAGAFKALGAISSTRNPTIKKLALATQLAVYKDVIPGYRIRPISEENQTEKVSREVKRLRAFEQSLVSSYQTYVKDLAVCAKSSRKDSTEADASIASVAIACTCTLLITVPHFNFRGELLKMIVWKLSGKRSSADFIKCRDTLVQFFCDDDDGTPSLDAVSLLTRMMKARNYQIHESVLNTFLHLRLLSEFSSTASQNSVDKQTPEPTKKPKIKREFRTRTHRKLLKARKAIAKDFAEADAIVSHEIRDRMQAETLKLVFMTYFRILKTHHSPLTGAVLEGLAKYAHLINQDFFSDLLEALKDILRDASTALDPSLNTPPSSSSTDDPQEPTPTTIPNTDPTRTALLAITTAYTLHTSQSRSTTALNLDLTLFTSTLSALLPHLALSPSLELSSKPPARSPSKTSPSTRQSQFDRKINFSTPATLLLTALSSLLLPRNSPPTQTAAFVKQLFSTSLHLPEKSARAVLALLGEVVKVQRGRIGGLWDTEEGGGVWEGELLRLHYAPAVREGVRGIERTVRADKQ